MILCCDVTGFNYAYAVEVQTNKNQTTYDVMTTYVTTQIPFCLVFLHQVSVIEKSQEVFDQQYPLLPNRM